MPLFGMGRKKSTEQAAAAAWASAAQPHPQPRVPDGLPEPHALPGDGDTDLLALLDLARAHDWPALRTDLAGRRDHDQSSLLSKVSTQSPDISDWLAHFSADVPRDALAQAVLGADAIERGWRVRTGKRAQHVSQDQFREFHEILLIAEEHLYAAVELDGGLVAPWYSLLTSGLGLQIDLGVQWRRFEALVSRSPGHLGGHRVMLQKLCRKWSGSHEQMHEFATEAMRGPYGDVLGELVPAAYYEHWGDLPKDSDERRFIESAESRAELQEAADRTIFRPGYANPRSPYSAANVFAWAFCRAGMWPQARAAFTATEGVVVNWAGWSDPAAVYTRQRTLAFQKA